jgi:hypothetical protein
MLATCLSLEICSVLYNRRHVNFVVHLLHRICIVLVFPDALENTWSPSHEYGLPTLRKSVSFYTRLNAPCSVFLSSVCVCVCNVPISRPTDATCDRFLFSIYMCITLNVSSVKRPSSGVPHRTYSLQFLCLCLSAALSWKSFLQDSAADRHKHRNWRLYVR